MGHDDGSVQARYTHITAEMRRRLLDGLTARWEDALAARRAMSRTSPVGALAELLRGLPQTGPGAPTSKIFSRISPERALGRR